MKNFFSVKKFSMKYFSTKMPKSFEVKLNQIKSNFYHLENLFPRNPLTNINDYLESDLISPNLSFKDPQVTNSIHEGILNPGWEMLSRDSKLWRPCFGLLFGDLFENKFIVDKEIIIKLLFFVEILHNSSLIIDDIQDKSEFRRNKKCVHLIYDEAVAINAGISMYYLPMFKLINQLKQKNLSIEYINEIYYHYLAELSAIHVGQGMDIEMKYNRIPLVETYFDIVLCKTGVFPRLIIKWIYNSIDPKLKNKDTYSKLISFVDFFSIAFQIKDDLMNIIDSKVSKDKGMIGEDIYEGKQSLMVLHALNLNTSKSLKLKEILFMKTKNQELINEAIDILKELGSIEFSQNAMYNYLEKSNSEINKLDLPNKEGIKEIIEFTNYIINR